MDEVLNETIQTEIYSEKNFLVVRWSSFEYADEMLLLCVTFQ